MDTNMYYMKQPNENLADESKETLEVLPQSAQCKDQQALVARMGCIWAWMWLAVDLFLVVIQSFREGRSAVQALNKP